MNGIKCTRWIYYNLRGSFFFFLVFFLNNFCLFIFLKKFMPNV